MPFQRDRNGRMVFVPPQGAQDTGAIDLSQPVPDRAPARPMPAAGADVDPENMSDLERTVLGLPPKSAQEDEGYGKWAAAGLRGAAGFIPGSPLGALAGGGAELVAQLLEGRGLSELNKTQITAQAALGFVPFGGKLKSLWQAGVRGSAHGALGGGATKLAETGFDTELSDIPEIAKSTMFGGTIGAVGGTGTHGLSKWLKGGPRGAPGAERYAAGVRHDPTAPRGDFDATGPITPRTVQPDSATLRPGQMRTPFTRPENHSIADTARHTGFDAPAEGSRIGVREAPQDAPAPVPPVAPRVKPRLTAPEVAGMLKGRQKLAGTVEDGAMLPPGAGDELDRMGVEYGRTQSALKALLRMTDADPAEVGRMQQGARELGSRLRRQAKTATTPADGVRTASGDQPLPPTGRVDDAGMSAVDDIDMSGFTPKPQGWVLPKPSAPMSEPDQLQRLLGDNARVDKAYFARNPGANRRSADIGHEGGADRRGAVDPSVHAGIANEMDALDATTRSRLGNETGEVSPELMFDMGAGTAGAGAGFMLSPDENKAEGTAAGALLGVGGRRAFKNPAGLERYVSAAMLSSPLTLAKIVLGNSGGSMIRAGQKAFIDGDPSVIGRTAREIFSPRTVDAVKEGFTSGRSMPDRVVSGYATEGPLSIPGRAIGALDDGFKDGMQRSGFSADEAADVALTSEPKSPMLKGLLDWQRSHRGARIPLRFLKTQAGMIDQGLFEPARATKRLLSGESGGFGRHEGGREDLAKIGTAAAMGAGGYAASQQLPAWAEPFGVALAGPMAAPAAIGAAMSHLPDDDDLEPSDYLTAAARATAQQLPLANEYDFDPRNLLAQLVPAPVRDIAKLTDEEDRETPGLFGKTFAKIPGLRQRLPEK